jgi:hypothetical protein
MAVEAEEERSDSDVPADWSSKSWQDACEAQAEGEA